VGWPTTSAAAIKLERAGLGWRRGTEDGGLHHRRREAAGGLQQQLAEAARMAATQPADRRRAVDSSGASAKRWDGGGATPATSAKVCAEEIHGGGVVRLRGIAGGGCAHGRKRRG
jgi:hypothetical protein